jgi:GNAT superfamily N-acetyltransferase
MSIHVRAIQASDYEAWHRLWLAYVTFYDTVVPDSQTELTWRRLLDKSFNINGLVAEQDGSVLGFTHYLFHPATWAVGDYCYLEDLFVDPTVRGSGAGRALIEGVKRAATAQGSTKVYWLTQNHNLVARQLYDSIAVDTGFMHYQIKL